MTVPLKYLSVILRPPSRNPEGGVLQSVGLLLVFLLLGCFEEIPFSFETYKFEPPLISYKWEFEVGIRNGWILVLCQRILMHSRATTHSCSNVLELQDEYQSQTYPLDQ